MAADVGVRNTSFISLIPANGYCMDQYVDPETFHLENDSRFRIWNHFHDYDYCSCSAGDYHAGKGWVRYYYRAPGKEKAPYSRQLVYTEDNRLLDGFGGNEVLFKEGYSGVKETHVLDKIGGIILKEKRLLVVQKKTKDNRPEYIFPGGKREGCETDLETLARELKEELQVELVSAEPFGGFDDIAIFENVPIHIEAYIACVAGEPRCDSEIKSLLWIDRNYKEQGIKLGSILEKGVIPRLIEMGLM